MSTTGLGGSGTCPGSVAYKLRIYPRLSAESASCCSITAAKDATAAEILKDAVELLSLDASKHYVLVEVKESGGEEWVLDGNDAPVHRVLLWPRRAQDDHPQQEGYYFLLQERNADGTIKYIHRQLAEEEEEEEEREGARFLVQRGFLPWQPEGFSDLCNLPNLTETTLLKNLKQRFLKHKIYTYVGSILVAINPFKFLPIYNPKYVQMYENHQLGKLEPHIFAIADVAYYAMLRKRRNQCIVISGESGSGKTQSTNFLIHCLTALSQKGYASGVERTILGAGPVLEAFGNAKTAHNNNSSRFGKFIQVNYLENGIVRGAVVEKYLLEKSRLVSREKNERNYHVFYYLLLGVSAEERKEFHLMQPKDYFYLNQHNLKIEDGEDLQHDFERLKQAMEMVGFLPATKKQIFSMLSAILYLGNISYKKRAAGRDEGLEVGPPEVLDILSELLKVKREILVEVLTKRKTVTVNDKLILPYSLSEAITARDSMAKSLYSALFDWIVLRINHALLNKKDMEESVTCLSIGVLDIFGFEDFKTNSFEQFCINYANEQLQYYFNQHIFKLEQEEYQSEGITWHNIDYTDNVGCIHLISKKPTGLFYLLDEESNFPRATGQTLLAKFKQQHEDNRFFIGTPVLEPAFIIQHFAGKVKYQIQDFREKNMDYMRPDIVALLRSSDSAYVRELIGMDPVAVFRWATLRAAIQAMAVFAEAGRQRARALLSRFWGLSSGPPHSISLSCVRHACPSCLRDLRERRIGSRKGLPRHGEVPRRLLQSLSRPSRFSFLQDLLDTKSLKFIVSMTLHDRTTKSLLHLHKKKKPPSISAQFQASLNKLLQTLGRAEPFFIRCIRSNSEKRELLFDEQLVLQQLRYTGMLETVRIRQSGYSAKFSFQDFVDQFQVLLPRNAKASQEEISALLARLRLDTSSFQIGKTKVFMKEEVRQVLQDTLHREVIQKIITLQSWLRMVLDRRRFLRARQAAITLQACWRAFCVRRALERERAAVCIQSVWRGHREQKSFRKQRGRVCLLQALVRGHLQRKSTDAGTSPGMLAEKGGPEQEPLPWSARGAAGSDSPLLGRGASVPDLSPGPKQEEGAGQAGLSRQGRPESPWLRGSRSFTYPQRPSELALGPPENLLATQSFRSPARKSKLRAPKGPGSPSSFPIQRYQDDQDKLRDKRKCWQGKRRMASPGQNSQSLEERSYSAESPSPPLLAATAHVLSALSPHPAPSGPPAEERPAKDAGKDAGKAKRTRTLKISKAKPAPGRWRAPRDIANANELKHLDEFLLNKINDLHSKKSAIECLFFEATEKFRGNLKTMYSAPNGQIHVGYHDLIENYQLLVVNMAKQKEEKDLRPVLNLFRSLLDEFASSYAKKEEPERSKQSKAQKTKRKQERVEFNGHVFVSYQVNILQSCEQCPSYIWPMEKACLCRICKLTCHRKCLPKVQSGCVSSPARKGDQGAGPRHFGVCVSALTGEKDSVPVVMEKLLEHVEMHGLYTEGIYRKSGSANRMKELKQLLQADPNSVQLEKYPIHTITGIFKQWLRELPEPLMTFSQYHDFLRAVELPGQQEQLAAIYSTLEQLPQAHHDTLERLIFHLVKVALVEDVNRMSPNALAIVFAPCLLRCPDHSDPLTSMKDVSKTTICVEMIIKEQMRKYQVKMQEICQLEAAETIAFRRLSLLRQSTVSAGLGMWGFRGGPSETGPFLPWASDCAVEASPVPLSPRLRCREEITYRLPELDHRGSDLDSEASASTESLLEGVQCPDPQGRYWGAAHPSLGPLPLHCCGSQRPAPPPRAPLRVRLWPPRWLSQGRVALPGQRMGLACPIRRSEAPHSSPRLLPAASRIPRAVLPGTWPAAMQASSGIPHPRNLSTFRFGVWAAPTQDGSLGPYREAE
uniref:Myosin IXB n=1 Tax=Varanus komodoensis TaxID=61221 RepID=A0A8D2IRN4_VARKO